MIHLKEGPKGVPGVLLKVGLNNPIHDLGQGAPIDQLLDDFSIIEEIFLEILIGTIGSPGASLALNLYSGRFFLLFLLLFYLLLLLSERIQNLDFDWGT